MTWRDSDPDALRAAARSVAKVPFLVASLIERWRSAFTSSPIDALNCTDVQLAYLALCRRPRHDFWMQDVTELAEGASLSPESLAQFVRAAEAAERFSDAHPVDSETDGRLMAARDRDEED